MRVANKAITREKHPTTTIEELLQELNGAKIFSKLDMNHGYLQIELSAESHHITTFSHTQRFKEIYPTQFQ